MCGITGMLLPSSMSASGHSAEWFGALNAMTDTLKLRGPDAAGQLIDPPLALGHRRLSILDPTPTGSQPMRLSSGGPVITYNGECFNFKPLRRELERLGCDFRSTSDTEVILHLYERQGLDGLRKLEGIFALALWDPNEQRLVLMRDRLGVKPLYYGDCRFGLAFGSEIKAVLAAGGVNTELDDQAFSEFLWFGNTFEDRTFFRGVRSIEPGHWMIIESGIRRLEPWWLIEDWIRQPSLSDSRTDSISKIRAAIDEAVDRQLVADVPVALFLSGGLDSSSIAAAAARPPNHAPVSYAAGFDFDGGINELSKAKAVAAHLGLDHNEMYILGEDLPDVLRTLAIAHDEPFADAANIPLYLMCSQLQGYAKVVLQGDGGDEMFGGYRRYGMLRHARWFRDWMTLFVRPLRACGSVGRRTARLVEALTTGDAGLRMALLLTTETVGQPPELVLTDERRRRLDETTDPFLAYRNAATRFAQFEPVQQMLLTDLTVQLPSQFLTKVDRASMAAGVEARVPLLDERVAEIAVGMNSKWKVRGRRNKIVLRKSQRGRLTKATINGSKTGFGVPYEYWLRTSLHEFTRNSILDPAFTTAFSLKPAAVKSLLDEHRNGVAERGFLLWKLLQLALWWNSQREVHPARWPLVQANNE